MRLKDMIPHWFPHRHRWIGEIRIIDDIWICRCERCPKARVIDIKTGKRI